MTLFTHSYFSQDSATAKLTRNLIEENSVTEAKITRLMSIGRQMEQTLKTSVDTVQHIQESDAALTKEIEVVQRKIMQLNREREAAKEKAFLLQIQYSGVDELHHRIDVRLFLCFYLIMFFGCFL